MAQVDLSKRIETLQKFITDGGWKVPKTVTFYPREHKPFSATLTQVRQAAKARGLVPLHAIAEHPGRNFTPSTHKNRQRSGGRRA